MDLMYDMAYGKELRYHRNSIWGGTFLTLLGMAMVVGKSNLGYLFILLGLGILISYFRVCCKTRSISEKLAGEKNETVSQYKENPVAYWHLSETDLTYSDFRGEVVLAWEDFIHFTIREENVFLFSKKSGPYIFGKTEAGEENYEKAIAFLKTKVTMITGN